MRKLLVITWNGIARRLTDPIALLLAVVVPLAVAALIHLAFGDVVVGRNIPQRSVPVGVVNHDRGGPRGAFGQVFVRALIPDPEAPTILDESYQALFSAREIEDEARARRMVERGRLVAALIIPADFSRALAAEGAALEVVVDGSEETLGMAFGSVVESLANALSSGEVAARTTANGLLRHPRTRTRLMAGALDEAIAEAAFAAALPDAGPIRVERVDAVQAPPRLNFSHYLAATIAVTFVSFTTLMMSAGLLQEREQWTLQRVYLTPTRPGIILGGRALGTFLTALIQMTVLTGGMAALAWALGDGGRNGPGVSALGLSALILAVAAAATGIGSAIAGSVGTYARAATSGGALLLLMALMGGVFFPVELFPQPFDLLSRVTFHYWAIDAYWELALGGGVSSVLPHVLVLAAMAVLSFAVGSWMLSRRIEFL